jgi:flavin reductase (DIM6/NTAB) family NADH-FMN oxidoreductase RutF
MKWVIRPLLPVPYAKSVNSSSYTAIDMPAELSEWAVSGLTQVPSQRVKPPRVAESAFSMECELGKSFRALWL